MSLFYLGIGIGNLGHVFNWWNFPLPPLLTPVLLICWGLYRLTFDIYFNKMR